MGYTFVSVTVCPSLPLNGSLYIPVNVQWDYRLMHKMSRFLCILVGVESFKALYFSYYLSQGHYITRALWIVLGRAVSIGWQVEQSQEGILYKRDCNFPLFLPYLDKEKPEVMVMSNSRGRGGSIRTLVSFPLPLSLLIFHILWISFVK